MLDQPAHGAAGRFIYGALINSLDHSHSGQSLLADKASALALLARVGVFGEEQLRPMQHVHQDGQLSLDQRTQTVLQC